MTLAKTDKGSPSPKTTTVSIPGSSVELDFTEAFGDVQYNNRKISLTFLCLQPWVNQTELETELKNAIHGKKMHIIFDDDPDHYYVGRISVGSWKYYKAGVGQLSVTIDAEPWKYRAAKTVTLPTKSTSGTESVTLTNKGRKWIVPTIDVSSSATIVATGISVVLSAGNGQIVPQLILEQGDTALSVTYTGTVAFHYQECDL